MLQPQILKQHLDDTYLITLKGEIDLSCADQVRDAISQAPDSGTVKVDTTGVTFIDSTGLKALIQGVAEIGSTRVNLVAGRRTRRLLELTGLEHQFNLVQ